MRSFLTILVVLTTSLASAADEASKLPPAAQAAVDRYTADVAKIKKDADDATVKRAAELAKLLAGIQDTVTKKGDLEGALAIKAEVATLPKAAEVKKVAATSPIKDKMVGKWRVNSAIFTLNADGTVLHNSGQTGTWTLDKDQKTISVAWNNGLTDTMMVPADGEDTTTGIGARKQILACSRLKD